MTESCESKDSSLDINNEVIEKINDTNSLQIDYTSPQEENINKNENMVKEKNENIDIKEKEKHLKDNSNETSTPISNSVSVNNENILENIPKKQEINSKEADKEEYKENLKNNNETSTSYPDSSASVYNKNIPEKNENISKKEEKEDDLQTNISTSVHSPSVNNETIEEESEESENLMKICFGEDSFSDEVLTNDLEEDFNTHNNSESEESDYETKKKIPKSKKQNNKRKRSSNSTSNDKEKPPKKKRKLNNNHENKTVVKRVVKTGRSEEEIYEIVNTLLSKMRIAYVKDEELMKTGRPALAKLELLREIELKVSNSIYQRKFIEQNILEELSKWLKPSPDKSLPNLRIRQIIFKTLNNLKIENISPFQLKQSEIGKFVHLYSKHPKESKENKDLTFAILEKWISLFRGNINAQTREQNRNTGSQKDIKKKIVVKPQISRSSAFKAGFAKKN